MRRQRLQFGGVFLNKQRGIWYYRRTVNGKRKLTPIGKLAEFPTKALAKEEAKNLIKANSKPKVASFEVAARCYMGSKRWPHHPPTAAGYRNYLVNYCIPRWGSIELSKIAAKPLAVELWLALIALPRPRPTSGTSCAACSTSPWPTESFHSSATHWN